MLLGENPIVAWHIQIQEVAMSIVRVQLCDYLY